MIEQLKTIKETYKLKLARMMVTVHAAKSMFYLLYRDGNHKHFVLCGTQYTMREKAERTTQVGRGFPLIEKNHFIEA